MNTEPERLGAGPRTDLLVHDPRIANGGRHLKGLNLAAESGAAPELLTVLLRRGAAVNQADNEGVTPLMWAAQRGDVESARALLSAGARADLKSRAGLDAATYADNRGDELGRAVAELLKK